MYISCVTVGDMEKVDITTRVSLSHCLDNSDWSMLADKLNLTVLMKGFEDGKSPTKVLLDYYEVIFTLRILCFSIS